jgi:hypothetical protein
MPTVAEVLKSAGLTDEQIAALDAKAVEGFTSVLTTAEQERQQAELAQRAATQMFEEQITPALNDWGVKEANLAAERDYYKTLAEKSKDGGFIAEVPPFKAEQPRGDGGKFVAGANAVPGSPNLQEFETKVAGAMGSLADLQWKYRTLFNKEMPDAPTALAAEATAQRMSMIDYAAKKYNFDGRKAEIEAAEKKAAEDKIREEVTKERDQYWAERTGNNPMVRMGEASRFAELKKGVEAGTRVDPLKMSRDQRHAATAQAIRQDIAATIQ